MYAGSVSNDWLESFKKCHNIGKFAVSGEAADVGEETVEVWHERVKSLGAINLKMSRMKMELAASLKHFQVGKRPRKG